jgi:hypothetical protein
MEIPTPANEITALCVVLTATLVWDMYKNRTKKDDDRFEKLIASLHKNTESNAKLEFRLSRMEDALGSLPRMKDGIRKIFNILRYQAGEDWPKLRKIMDDDLKS